MKQELINFLNRMLDLDKRNEKEIMEWWGLADDMDEFQERYWKKCSYMESEVFECVRELVSCRIFSIGESKLKK